MVDDNSSATKAVGPYMLQRTLGKGQTGEIARLKLAYIASYSQSPATGDAELGNQIVFVWFC